MQDSGGGNTPGVPGAQPGSGLTPNVAGALSYVLGALTGIIFILIEKRDSFVRFHAMQSIFLTVAWIALSILLNILGAILGIVPVIGPIFALIIGLLVSLGIGLGGFILWIMLIVKAYQGQKWKLPYIGDMAEKYAATVNI